MKLTCKEIAQVLMLACGIGIGLTAWLFFTCRGVVCWSEGKEFEAFDQVIPALSGIVGTIFLIDGFRHVSDVVHERPPLIGSVPAEKIGFDAIRLAHVRKAGKGVERADGASVG